MTFLSCCEYIIIGRREKEMAKILVSILFTLLVASSALGAGPKPVTPLPKDKCPVCGMFVAKYPDFVAQIIFRDGTCAVFDGVKDMLKYRYSIARFAPGKKAADIAAIYATDYYTLSHIDGYRAFFVFGSDVFGPMGKELIPFQKKADALEFMKDHKGRAVLTFKEITPSVMKSLE
jgi:nitrous oxide reductase accessory protein NosL